MGGSSAGSSRTRIQNVGLALGPMLCLAVLLGADPGGDGATAGRMAAVAVLMAAWWITEAIPLFATALLPMVLFPMLGILSGRDTAPLYVNSTIFLFIGGFMIALAMERWGLHRRIALVIIRLIGGGPRRLILGFMVAAAFLSMWISNTATAIMMVPIGMAIVLHMESVFDEADTRPFTLGLMLGIAYACSVGGMATLVGTPPNLAFIRIFEITFPDSAAVSFGTWFLMGLPLAAAMLVIIWLIITRWMCRIPAHVTVERGVLDREAASLGPMSFEERAVLVVFATTAGLWLFRKDLVLGVATLPGWSRLIPFPDLVDDGTVAMAMALLLFFVPTRSRDAASPTVMAPDVLVRLPWDIVLLFGGGFALAKGFQVSGLSAAMGEQFAGLAGLPPVAMIAMVCAGLTFLTEVTSNTATTQMILPILASVAVQVKTNPLVFMIPATLAASCAFMMPVATPPNAIVFGSGRVRMIDMARVGLVINLVGVVVITVLFITLGVAVFGIDLAVFPDWAVSPVS
jgi:sodium-dependent dicarboxylate transporter 2/3/5